MTFPTLDLALQAERLVPPVTRWGRIARTSIMTGTYHFMTDDYRFASIERRAHLVPASGCRVAVEVNFTTRPDMTPGEALATIFRKRRLSAFWQSRGVRIVVDMNVEPCFRHLILEGVPRGWRAYGARHHFQVPLAELQDDFRQAAAHAGTDDILFCVFGGGNAIKAACLERGWQWVPEDAHVATGRQRAYGQ